MDFTGSIITAILPPQPIKADLRAAQFQAANDPERKFTIAKTFVQAKIARSLEVLDWLEERHDIQHEIVLAKHEAMKLGKASSVKQLRTVEGRTALRYWQAYQKALPESLGFKGRLTTTRNNYATDPVNAALNYGYGFLKVECRIAINTVGLEPAVGFLHELSRQQTAESLVYDLEEPFRFLVDLAVIKAFESGWLGVDDFAYNPHDFEYMIQFEGRRRLLHLLRARFNAGINYKGRTLKWDTVIEEKTNELARFLNGRSQILSFEEPAPILERSDSSAIREKILSLTQSEARKQGIGKSTLFYLRRNATDQRSFKVYSKVKEKIAVSN
jgi:CRISPR-associated protein Cas1